MNKNEIITLEQMVQLFKRGDETYKEQIIDSEYCDWLEGYILFEKGLLLAQEIREEE